MKIFKVTLSSLVVLALVLFGLIRVLNFYPDELQKQEVTCTSEAPLIKKGQNIKIMSWNVQYMAGRNYVFFYDDIDGGDDTRPSSKDIKITTRRVSEIIKLEKPDIILMQEVDEGATRTDHGNQTNELLERLSNKEYPCRTEAFYWKSTFVPHPKVMGSVGMKLVTFSKYKITEAYRHKLPQIPKTWIEMQFYLKRGVLEVMLPYESNKSEKSKMLHVLNTHLSAFAQGTNNMEQQVKKILNLLSHLDDSQSAWIIGGDFNLLPNSIQHKILPQKTSQDFNAKTELSPLIEKYKMVPTLEETTGEKMADWFTYSQNVRSKTKPLLYTLDYFFFSNNLVAGSHYVRTKDTIDISDHMPVISHFKM